MSNFQPIAMRCTQEDFDSIKHLIKYKRFGSFVKFPYLVNNFGDEKGVCSNVSVCNSKYFSRKVYEEFNADIFLKSLKEEEEEETFKVSKADMLIFASWATPEDAQRMKSKFPKAFKL